MTPFGNKNFLIEMIQAKGELRRMKRKNKLPLKSRERNVHNKMKLGFAGKVISAISRSATIRIKLIAAFFVPIAFILLLGYVSFEKAAQGLRSSYENSTKQAIHMTSEYLQFGGNSIEAWSTQFINEDNVDKFFTSYYSNNAVDYNTNYKAINTSIEAKATTDEFISQITVLSDQVDSLTTADNVESKLCDGFFQTDLGKSLKNSTKIEWVGSNTYLDQKLGIGPDEYALRLIRSLSGDNALLVIDMDTDTVQEILKNMEFDKTGTIGLVTSDGKEILSGTKGDSKDAVFTGQAFYKKAVASDQTSGADYVTYRGKSNLFMYSKIGKTGAMICAVIPKSTIVSQADSIRKITIIIVLIACIVAVLTGLIISIGIDKTIRVIISKLKKAASGDLTVDFSTKRKDEFRILMNEINHTFSNMKDLIGQVKVLSGEVSEASLSVAKTSEAFLNTSGEISTSMNEIEQGVMQQAKDAEQCLQQMDNLSNKITLMSEHTNGIEKIAEDTKRSIQEGTIATGNLNEQTKSTMDITNDIVKGIEDLAEKSKSIDSIVNVISEISNQTNLLSLNASIEAARAGEFGKGFAVVAEEIRTLSDQTRNSVHDIKNIIKNIQDNTSNVVKTAKQAEDVMQLQDTAVRNTTVSYQGINESVDNLMIHLKNIIDNVNNMEEARVSTLGAIENISAVLEEVAASSNNVNQISGNQLISVESLNQSAGNLNHNSEQLVSATKKFIV